MRLFVFLLLIVIYSFQSPLEIFQYQKNKEVIENALMTTTCRCADSLVLVQLYEATDGPNWKEKWDLVQSIDVWNGITLNGENCVAGINLNANNLQGTIPEAIGELQALKNLSLGNNQLIGKLPASINNLKLLESLNLRSNELSGELPTDLDNLEKLTTLNLSVNQFSGTIPSSIGKLTNLTGLFLNQNNFSGSIPFFLGDLKELVGLNLGGNQFNSAIPVVLGQLPNLTGMGLNDNQLTGAIPLSFGFLNNLVSLRLEDNHLTGSIPEELGNLPRIETIFLFNNDLSGCYPEALKNLCTLLNNESQTGRGYNFSNNPQLPWQGDFVRFCDGEMQMGATCDDMEATTLSDAITADCTCAKAVGNQEDIESDEMISVTFDIIGTCPTSNTGKLFFNIQPENTSYQIDWIDPKNTFTTLKSRTTSQIKDLGAGAHRITIIDENDPSRVYTEVIQIPALNCFDLSKVPQAITPNGDGLNDRFIFDDLEYNPSQFSDNEIVIFNRWGDVVFQAKPYQNNWAGQTTVGNILPEGTYYYVFELDLNEGLIVKGAITVIR